jgi:hypothetical protein
LLERPSGGAGAINDAAAAGLAGCGQLFTRYRTACPEVHDRACSAAARWDGAVGDAADEPQDLAMVRAASACRGQERFRLLRFQVARLAVGRQVRSSNVAVNGKALPRAT